MADKNEPLRILQARLNGTELPSQQPAREELTRMPKLEDSDLSGEVLWYTRSTRLTVGMWDDPCYVLQRASWCRTPLWSPDITKEMRALHLIDKLLKQDPHEIGVSQEELLLIKSAIPTPEAVAPTTLEVRWLEPVSGNWAEFPPRT